MIRADGLEEILKPGCCAGFPWRKQWFSATFHLTARLEAGTGGHHGQELTTNRTKDWTRKWTRKWTRRAVLAGPRLPDRDHRAADAGRRYAFSQYHNQAAGGTLHRNLTAMWEAVRLETNGRSKPPSMPKQQAAWRRSDALKLLISGEIQFLHPDGRHHRHRGAGASPAIAVRIRERGAGAQGDRRSARPICRPGDGGQGVAFVSGGRFDNGMRQVATIPRPSRRRRISPGMKNPGAAGTDDARTRSAPSAPAGPRRPI